MNAGEGNQILTTFLY